MGSDYADWLINQITRDLSYLFIYFIAVCRELVARVILETLRSIPVPDDQHDLSRVLAIISRLGEDPGKYRFSF